MPDAAYCHGLHFGMGGHRPDAGNDHVERGRDCQPPHTFGYWRGGESAQERRTFPQRPDNRSERHKMRPRRTPERCAEGDDRVDLPGEPTGCDGLRDDDPAQAVSDQMQLIGAGLRQHSLNLGDEPVG